MSRRKPNASDSRLSWLRPTHPSEAAGGEAGRANARQVEGNASGSASRSGGGTAGRGATRRMVLAAGAGAFGYATLQTEPVRAAMPALAAYQAEGSGWAPRLLTPAQGELLATLCEHILPRTDKPGARDAGVHEFIDLELSLADGKEQLRSVGGLDWVDRRAQAVHGARYVDLDAARQVEMLREISDEHESHPAELAAGAAFFSDLKRRTLFAYYTSKTGRTEALGLSDRVRVERFRGCQDDKANG